LASLRIAEEDLSMRFAVIGSQGMFGSEMVMFLTSKGRQVQAFTRENIHLDSSIEEITAKLSSFDVVINAVGYTAVDRAESEPEIANIVNGHFPEKLATASNRLGARFFQISTDYVFDGFSTTPFKTNDPRNPQGAYGRSKALGEKLVEGSGARYTIFRTAWLYGAQGNCFPKTIIKKAAQGQAIQVVNDQIGQPTWTKDLAEQVFAFSQLEQSVPIVHAVASGKASWFDFAKEIVGDYEVEPVSTSEFITAAKRPAFSVLDNSSELVPPIGDWRDRWQIAKNEIIEST
jgi:dTDP-4-dehydrorhamnose reductase